MVIEVVQPSRYPLSRRERKTVLRAQRGGKGRGNDGEVRARRRLYTDDGLPERAVGDVLQLHPDGLLAIPPRVPDPRGSSQTGRERPADPGPVRPSED